VSANDKGSTNIVEYGKVRINRVEHKVYFDEDEVILTNREYEALIFLIENPDRTVTFEEIGKKIFGQYLDTDRQTIMVIMSRLRKKMKVSEQFSNMIETVWGKGYKFISDLNEKVNARKKQH
jgi:DNA-binding response OmpR family regulator